MRNSSKLKLLLARHDVTYSMNHADELVLILTEKNTGKKEIISGKNTTDLMNKAMRLVNGLNER